jgi:hypothetical protein
MKSNCNEQQLWVVDQEEPVRIIKTFNWRESVRQNDLLAANESADGHFRHLEMRCNFALAVAQISIGFSPPTVIQANIS